MTAELPAPTGRLDLPDHRRLAWDEHGPSNGFPVIYLHGIPSCRVMWSGVAAAAQGAGVRLIVIDRPGCGLSTFQPDRRVTDLAADVSALADHLLLQRYAVAGISGGGPYALACAAAGDPRLVRTVVTNGVGPLDSADAIAGLYDVNRPVFEAAAAGLENCRPIIEQLAAGAEASANQGPGALADVLAAMPPEDRAVIEQHPEIMAETADLGPAIVNGPDGLAYDLWLSSQPWGFDLTAIDIPVDIYAADHDRNVPLQHAVDQAAQVPHSTLTVWPGSGHLSGFVRLPQVLQELVANVGPATLSTAGSSARTA